MKHTLKYCQRMLRDHTIIAYFFNARGDSFEKTFLGMLRSLVWQLLEEEPTTRKQFMVMHNEKRRKHGKVEWTDSELSELLLSQALDPRSNPLVLLVDALDECSDDHVRQTVEFLEELSTRATDAGKELSICLSSRHYPHISMAIFRDLVLEDANEHRNDISKYIKARLRTQDQRIVNTMLRKASGIFSMYPISLLSTFSMYRDPKSRAPRRARHLIVQTHAWPRYSKATGLFIAHASSPVFGTTILKIGHT